MQSLGGICSNYNGHTYSDYNRRAAKINVYTRNNDDTNDTRRGVKEIIKCHTITAVRT